MFKFWRLFFPGFTWEHGFALWDVGTAIGIGASVVGGMMGDDAAQTSAGQSNEGIQAGINELKKQGEQTRADTAALSEQTRTDTAPYMNLGDTSTNRLSFLLGLDPLGGATFGGAKPGAKPTIGQIAKDNAGAIHTAGLAGGKKWSGTDQARADAYTTKLFNEALAKWTTDTAQWTTDSEAWRTQALADAQAKNDPAFGSLFKQFDANDLSKDFPYNNGLQFGLDTGTKAIETRNRASGSSDSGAVLKELLRFGNDYGTTKTEGAYNRNTNEKQNIYTMLTSGSNTGLNAVGLNANVGTNNVNTNARVGSNIASAIAGGQADMGNNNAAATMGSANAWSNTLGDLGDIAGGINWGSGSAARRGNVSSGIDWSNF